jgi:hypothetical protein
MPLVCRAAYSRPHSFALAGVLLAVLLAPSSARASSPPWIDPSPAELQMTSEPKAPGAPAILLSWEEHDDANSAEVVVHVRLKVLTEGGLSAGRLIYQTELSATTPSARSSSLEPSTRRLHRRILRNPTELNSH